MRVGKHLDLDVPRALEILFQVDDRIGKSRLSFGSGHVHRVKERRLGVHDAHAAAAATARRRDDDRIADLARDAHDLFAVLRQGAVRSGHRGHAGFRHRLFGAYLVTHQADVLRPRPDEHEARAFHLLGKVRVLGEKAVAGVNGLGVRDFGGADDGRDVQVARCRRRRPDADRLVGQLYILGFSIRFRVHHHRADPHLAAGALNAKCDLAAVGDQDLFEH